jgi:hypothetical protein
MGFLGALALGTTATLKPSLAASFRRSWPRGAGRTSPARPTSPKAKKPLGSGLPAQAAGDGQHHRQVGRRFADAHTAHGVHKHILIGAGHTRVAVQHGQQHGQAVALQAHRQAPGAGAAAIDQRLDFHQQRARALQRHQHAAAGHRLAVLAQERWRWGCSRP